MKTGKLFRNTVAISLFIAMTFSLVFGSFTGIAHAEDDEVKQTAETQTDVVVSAETAAAEESEHKAGPEDQKELEQSDNTKHSEAGSLKIRNIVTVNGAATDTTAADGTYTFTVKNAEGSVKATETITITNGASGTVQVDDLVPGKYTVSEETDKNPEGMALVGGNNKEVEVKTGGTGEIPTAEFTNNRTVAGSLKIRKNVTVNGAATDTTAADGTYTFTVKDSDILDC